MFYIPSTVHNYVDVKLHFAFVYETLQHSILVCLLGEGMTLTKLVLIFISMKPLIKSSPIFYVYSSCYAYCLLSYVQYTCSPL